ncbi:hypothetical protein BgiMline_024320, partial [Biomphalaria glabrata]
TSEQTLSQRLERQTQEKQEQTSLEIRQIQNELTQINDTLKNFIGLISSKINRTDVCSLVEFNNSEAPPGCLKNSSLFPTPTNPPSVPKKRNETSGLGIAKSRPDTNRLGNRFVITTLNTKSNDASISQFSDIGRHEITSGNKELRAVETIHQLELEEPSVHNCFTIESSQTFAKNHTIFCTNYYSTEPVPCKVCICLHFDKMNRLNVQACVSPDSVNTKWPVFLVGEGEIYNPATKKFLSSLDF